MSAVPVTLVTGFLGAGKSTLIARILRDPRFAETAVVVNEFGEVGLDGELVAHESDQIVEMTTGCLCCTVRGDIRDTLLRLQQDADAGRIPTFARLVVETTGLADPAPVIATLMHDRQLVQQYALAGVVTVIDVVTGEATLDRHPEAVRQAALADRVVLSKTDLAHDPASRKDVALLKERLRVLNPGADQLDLRAADFELGDLFATEVFDPSERSFDARDWLNAEAYATASEAHHDHHDHEHAHHYHDPNRHDANIRAFCVTLERPISTAAFTAALELMSAQAGPKLLRVKGIVCLAEKPENPVAIHGVQHVFHDPMFLSNWPDDDRRSRLVFITDGFDPETMARMFEAWGSDEV